MSLLPAKAAVLAQHACRPSPRGTVPDPPSSSIGGGGGGVCLACLAARGRRPGQDEREADRKRSEHAAGTACAPCRPRRRVLALFCQSLPGLLISRLFPCNNHQIIANTKGTCLLISRLFPCWSNRQGDESFGRSSRIR
jgi:hypothetical protein